MISADCAAPLSGAHYPGICAHSEHRRQHDQRSVRTRAVLCPVSWRLWGTAVAAAGRTAFPGATRRISVGGRQTGAGAARSARQLRRDDYVTRGTRRLASILTVDGIVDYSQHGSPRRVVEIDDMQARLERIGVKAGTSLQQSGYLTGSQRTRRGRIHPARNPAWRAGSGILSFGAAPDCVHGAACRRGGVGHCGQI